MATSAVKGVWRTFILTLDRDRRHGTLEMGTKRNPFLFSFVPYWKKHRWNKHRFLASLLTTAETGWLTSTLPGFYPHSEWAALGPVHVGVRFHAQVRHRVADLGC